MNTAVTRITVSRAEEKLLLKLSLGGINYYCKSESGINTYLESISFFYPAMRH